MNGARLTLDEVVRLAESAAADIEAHDVASCLRRANLVMGAALGLLLLAEIGAVVFNGDGELPPNVELGEDLADGERRFAPYQALLARLGWVRDTDYWHRDCDPLGIVYKRQAPT